MKRHKKILFGSIIASLCLHALALVFLQRYSLWFSSTQQERTEMAWQSFIEKRELDEIFQATFAAHPEEEQPLPPSGKPDKEMVALFKLPTSLSLPHQDPLPLLFFQHTFPQPDLLTFPTLSTFAIPSHPLDLLAHLPKELLIPTAPTSSPIPPPSPIGSTLSFSVKLPEISSEAPKPPLHYPTIAETAFSAPPKLAKAPPLLTFPNLPQLPTLNELETSSFSESFEAELVFLPREEGARGYIFALTLIPKSDLYLPKIRQNYLFLIDRSNSIQQERLTATKSAIRKVLAELSAEDTFNILAFDSKTEKMAPLSLPCTSKSLATAENFLDKLQLGSFFSSSDLYRPLLLTVPSQVENDEIYTAILLTDGESLGKKQAPQTILRDWTHFNSGKVALYTLSLHSDPHSSTLDAASTFNKGKLFTAPTNRGIKRKLLKLIKTIQTPIAKNLSCCAISKSGPAKIQLFPKASQAPHLYLDQPYVILGETETLDDFILFVQGRLKDRWLNIKKKISFVNAKKGNKSLKKEWALQQAYDLYEQYSIDLNPSHLVEAQSILEPFDLSVAFR